VVGVVAIRGVFKRASGSVEPAALLAKLDTNAESPPLPKWIVDWNSACERLSQQLRDEEQDRGIR
jgi:hypothetical protein